VKEFVARRPSLYKMSEVLQRNPALHEGRKNADEGSKGEIKT
jgi:hypothetical protein